MNNKPCVSIIIPVYNVEDYVEECIKSVLDQSLKNIEIIIINDGSTDNSLEVISSFKDERIKVINKENGGLSSARNVGIKESCGEYITFLDSDDFLITNACLANVYSLAKQNNLDLVECKYDLYKENNTFESRGKYLNDFNRVVVSTDEYLEKLIDKNFIPVCFKVFSRELIVKNKLFFREGFLHEDEDFTPRIILNTKKIGIFNKSYYGYRVRSGSITNTKNIKRFYDSIAICYDLLKYYNTFEDCRNIRLLKERAINMIIENIYINNINIEEKIKKYLLQNTNTRLNKFRIKALIKDFDEFLVINKNIIRITSKIDFISHYIKGIISK